MSNLKQNNLHNLKLIINKDEYWDFFVDKDRYSHYNFSNGLYDDCLCAYIDICNDDCVSGDTWILSTNNYTWENSVSIDNTMYNISYTGLDNGQFQFRKDRVSNKEFWELYQNNPWRINEGDNRLKLHAVSGNTLQYEYPLHLEKCQVKLNGGFYQGFFKTQCDKYQVLPSKLSEDSPWEFEFQLKKCDLEKESNKTLNDKYPENKGIFFYIGTRAENKWSYLYKKEDECEDLSPDDYVEDAHIDKDDYIIGNFYDPNPEYIDEFNLDNFLNYNYYDEKLYEKDCEDEYFGLEDFIDFSVQPKVINEELPHDIIGCDCCNSSNSKNIAKSRAYYRGCQCSSCGCIKETFSRNNVNNCNNVNNEEFFGEDGLISDFDGLDDGRDYIEPEMDITYFDYKTDNELSIRTLHQEVLFTTDNKFITFNRTSTGYTVDNWVEGTQFEMYGRKDRFKGNLFILMNRTCTGYTVDNIESIRESANSEYNMSELYDDIYNNALAFRITDDGKIGYRLLTVDCTISGDDKTSIEEGYSFPNVIKDCEWQTIHVKIIPSSDTMKMYFYVDGKLVYITKSLPKINLREINEPYEKQEGVPYNISLGGGTQGLAETILPNYMINPTKVYPLEKNFAGTFIGYLRSFKFYNCPVEYGNIVRNYKFEKKNNKC